MDNNVCKQCFWEYHGSCNYPWDCSETETPNVPPHCVVIGLRVNKMTNDEKILILAYLQNQGLRLDRQLLDAKRCWDTRHDYRACMALLDALQQKTAFDKFSHDLCALLNI